MQKNRDQRDLLRDPQQHLENTCRPSGKESTQPAQAKYARLVLILAARVDWLFDQGRRPHWHIERATSPAKRCR
jgi:hypothetical protein